MTSITLAANASGSTNVAGVNDTRLDDFEKFVKQQADLAAKGKDALPIFAIGFVRAVSDGVIDIAKDANGEDGATRYFKKYSAYEGKKAFHDRSQASQKSQISKLKQLQNAAGNPKYDFVDVLNRAVTIRQTAIDDGIDVKSPYPAYVDVAREQLKQDDDLDDAQIFGAVTKTDSTKEVTKESLLKRMHKIAEDIITGEKYPGVIDQSGEMHAIEELVRNKLNETVALREKNERVDELIAMGATKNADGSWTV